LGVALHGYYGDYALTILPFTEAEVAAYLGCGFNVPFQGRISLFPRVWLGLGWMTQTVQAGDASNYIDPTFLSVARQTNSGFYGSLELQVPLHIQLAATTYLEAGPFGYLRLARGDVSRGLRLGLLIGIGRVF
jgi:hypothetical protein